MISNMSTLLTSWGNKCTIGWPKVNWWINEKQLKDTDSELWFVENTLHTAWTGQSTHEDLVKKLSMACGAFCLRSLACSAFGFISKLACSARFPQKKLPFNHLGMPFIWTLEVVYSVYQFISGKIDLNFNNEWSQRHNLYQTVITKVSNKTIPLWAWQIKPLEIQIAQHDFNSKTIYLVSFARPTLFVYCRVTVTVESKQHTWTK